MIDRRAEAQALLTRAAIIEAQRQGAVARGDHVAAHEFEIELSRIWSRYVDLERQTA